VEAAKNIKTATDRARHKEPHPSLLLKEGGKKGKVKEKLIKNHKKSSLLGGDLGEARR
jgi:hypothetical protein